MIPNYENHLKSLGRWTPEQIKKIEASNYFEKSREIHIFGRTYFLSPSEYRALRTLLIVGAVIATASTVYVVSRMARPGGWQAEVWSDVSDGLVKP